VHLEGETAPRARFLAGLAVAVGIPALLYGLTLWPGVGGRLNPGDSAKFQFIGHVLGIPHETGYPQYVLLNWLWTRLPLPGSLAWRVNLLSAVLALAAGALLYLLAWRLTRRAAAAAVAVVAVLVTQTLWTVATEAEVYTLHLFWVSLVLVLAERWMTTRRDGHLAALLFAYAAGFGNHMTMITLLPAMLVAVLVTRPGVLVTPKWIAIGIAAAAAGALQYAFLWVRARQGAPYREALRSIDPTWDQFVAAVTGSRHTEDFFLGSGIKGLLFDRVGALVQQAAVEMLFPALVMAAVGAVAFVQQRMRTGAFLCAAAAGVAFFAAAYEIPDWTINAIPLWAIAGVTAAVGLAAVLERRPAAGRAALAVVALGVAVTIAYRLPDLTVASNPWDRGPLVDRSPDGAIILTHGDSHYHAQQVTNYYRLGEPAIARRSIRMMSVTEYVLSLDVLRGSPVLFEDASLRSDLNRLGVAYRPRSYIDTLPAWLKSRPSGAQVMVASAWLDDAALRAETAAALRQLGSVREGALADRGPYVVAALVVGSSIEADTSATAARLSGSAVQPLTGEGPRVTEIRAISTPDERAVGFEFGEDGFVSREPAIHAIWRDEPTADWSQTHFELLEGLPRPPLYFERIPRPAPGALQTRAGGGGPLLVDEGGGIVSSDSSLPEALVLDANRHEFVMKRRFDFGRGPSGMDGLAKLLDEIDGRHVVLVIVPGTGAIDVPGLSAAVGVEIPEAASRNDLVIVVRGTGGVPEIWHDPPDGTLVWSAAPPDSAGS
jgi:hypothetical protein